LSKRSLPIMNRAKWVYECRAGKRGDRELLGTEKESQKKEEDSWKAKKILPRLPNKREKRRDFLKGNRKQVNAQEGIG